MAGDGMLVVIAKNTFLEVVTDSDLLDGHSAGSAYRRSASESDTSRHSSQLAPVHHRTFWEPSTSSYLTSSNSSEDSRSSKEYSSSAGTDPGLRSWRASSKFWVPQHDRHSGAGAVASAARAIDDEPWCDRGHDGGLSGPSGVSSSFATMSVADEPPADEPLTCEVRASRALASPGALMSQGFVGMVHAETGVPRPTLEALHECGLLAQIPRDGHGTLTSVGSIKHAGGDCSPCLFWFRKACARGIACDYCHSRHKGQRNKRIRPSRKTRMRAAAHERRQTEGDDGTSGPDSSMSDTAATRGGECIVSD